MACIAFLLLLFLVPAVTLGSDEIPSIEELMEMEVISVAKKPQSITQTAASIFVITHEDIRRSGATSIPEVLRLAPGVNVAHTHANQWAVSIRGGADLFANKLLVMLDGRSLYTPLFAGINWETQDVSLEEIERIEVIRGPGAAVWGANAVNGVINIITRHAGDSHDALLTAAVGTEERGRLSLRQGIELGEEQFLRLTAKIHQVDHSLNLAGEPAADDANHLRFSGRWDGDIQGDKTTLSVNHYQGSVNNRATRYLVTPPWQRTHKIDGDYEGAALVGSWQHENQDGSLLRLSSFVDYNQIDTALLADERFTFDLELQHQIHWQAQEWIWGMGYRQYQANVFPRPLSDFEERRRSLRLFSLFIQDEITLLPEYWTLTLGSRLEHNDFTGFEIQPNARLLWRPHPSHTLWSTLARATRTPSLGEQDGLSISQAVLPPGYRENPSPLPIEVVLVGNADVASEVLHALELGYRGQWNNQFSMSLVGFVHAYQNTIDVAWDGTTLEVLQDRIVMAQVVHNIEAEREVRGLELSLDWRMSKAWQISTAYSYLHAEDSDPPQQLSLRVSYDPLPMIELDFWLKYVAKLGGERPIPAYTTLDFRLAWQVHSKLELSLVGQNLLDSRHPEFETRFFNFESTEIQRGGYLQVAWRF